MKREGLSRAVVALRSIAPLAATGLFLPIAVGLADLQCLPGHFDPARATSADAVQAVVEGHPSYAPYDLDRAIVISGTNSDAGAGVQLDARPLDGLAWLNSTRLEATVAWGLDPGLYPLTCTLRQPTVPCRHAPTATYYWPLDGSRLTFQFVGEDPCRPRWDGLDGASWISRLHARETVLGEQVSSNLEKA